jgi:ribosomal RNA large subunit methyltransferase H
VKISVFSIQKSDEFKTEISQYIKMSKFSAEVVENVIFNDKIAKAQSKSRADALKSYDEAYAPHVKGYCIGLDESGEMVDSFEFANILKDRVQISFFIGGAYGFSSNFRAKMDRCISLSRLTFAHKIAKLVLFEQIYRALCINANHPYHK